MISVFTFSRQKLIRDGWNSFLSSRKGIKIVGSSDDYHQAYSIIAEVKPRIIILHGDIVANLATLRTFHKLSPLSATILVTAFCPREYFHSVTHSGVKGLLHNDSSLVELHTAISQLLLGQTYLSTESPAFQSVKNEENENRQLFLSLTDRELQVASLLGKGNTSREISDQLNISIRTTEVHRRNILTKMRCRKTTDLVRKLKITIEHCNSSEIPDQARMQSAGSC